MKKRLTLLFSFMREEGTILARFILVDSAHCTGDTINLASIFYNEWWFNIHLFALEHLCYGLYLPNTASTINSTSSHVLNSTAVINIPFLSSCQALADLANFTPQMITRYKLKNNHNVCWIKIDESYPGMIAAWAYLKLYVIYQLASIYLALHNIISLNIFANYLSSPARTSSTPPSVIPPLHISHSNLRTTTRKLAMIMCVRDVRYSILEC